MAKKIKARVFFGEYLSDALYYGDRKEAKRIFEDGDGAYSERQFNTEAERLAYYQGMDDMGGWNGCYVLEDSERKPRWAHHTLD